MSVLISSDVGLVYLDEDAEVPVSDTNQEPIWTMH